MENQNWYDLNGTRNYPLDDASTARDDRGEFLPTDILVDASITFPRSLGEIAFLTAVSVTPNLVTVLMACSNRFVLSSSLSDEPEAIYTAIASFTIAKKSMQKFRAYPIVPLSPGAAGWLVFGDGIDTPYSGRFSSHEQSGLLLRCANSFDDSVRPGSVRVASSASPLGGMFRGFSTTIGKPMTGVVKLKTRGDMDIRYEEISSPYAAQASLTSFQREDADQPPVEAIVLSLKDRQDRNVYDYYRGECTERPQADTCVIPPIEKLGPGIPDCNGNINITFEGWSPVLTDSEFAMIGGQLVAYDVTLADACANDEAKYPNDDGHLASLGIDLCDGSEANSGTPTTSPETPVSFAKPMSFASELTFKGQSFQSLSAPIPEDAADDPDYEIVIEDGKKSTVFEDYWTDFESENDLPDDWYGVSGSWDQSELCSRGGILCYDVAKRNIAYREFSSLPSNFTVSTTFTILSSAQRNAGLALFLKEIGGRPRYLHLSLNKTNDSMEFIQFNGYMFSKPLLQVKLPGLASKDWYRLVASCRKVSGGWDVRAELHNLTIPYGNTPSIGYQRIYFPASTAGFGVCTIESMTSFCDFSLKAF